jgi:hypothetical protein
MAASTCLAQSTALLVLHDILHKSLLLHTLRVIGYASSVGLFYWNAYYSYDLVGNEGYRASCPATCNFRSFSRNWVYLLVVGAPVFSFIILDLVRSYLKRYNPGRVSNKIGIGFRVLRVLAWLLCVGAYVVGFFTMAKSTLAENYGGLIVSPSSELEVWGFGQLVAVILLILPFLGALQEWKGKTPVFCLSSFTRRSKANFLQMIHMKTSREEMVHVRALIGLVRSWLKRKFLPME